MREIGGADLGGVFLRAPMAVRYFLGRRSTVPKHIPAELDAARVRPLAPGRAPR